MRSRTPALLLVLLLGAVGALLGGASAAQAHTTGAHTAAAAPKTVNIMIMGYAFSPADVTVNPGDTVIWTNMDTAKHDATSLTGPATFGGPLIGKGETYTWVATASGPYTYYCSVHPDMKASLTVAPAAAAAPAPVSTKAPAAAAPRTTTTASTPARTSATNRGSGSGTAQPPADAGAGRGSTAGAAGSAGTSGTSSRAGSAAAQAPAAAAPATQAPVTQAVAPVSEPEDALDPTLLVVALAVGAAVFGLLVLGPRAPRTVRVVVPAAPTPTAGPAPGPMAAPAEDVRS